MNSNPASGDRPTADTLARDPADACSTANDADAAAVVCCRHLSKHYGSYQALADCNLSVPAGTVFGLLGPNGAGKTTLIRLLLGYLSRSAGTVTVCGHDPAIDSVAIRSRTAYLPGDARLPRHMNGKTVLKFFAEIHPGGNLTRSLELSDRLELDTQRRVGFMSTGMRQKLALATVLSLDCDLLILDEPTANLDPTVRSTVLDLVMEANADGRTVILSSHVLSEIEDTCHQVAFLKAGRLVKELQMADLFQLHRVNGFVADQDAFDGLKHSLPASLAEQIQVKPLGIRDGMGMAVQIDTAGDLNPCLQWLADRSLQRVRIEPYGLRNVYDSVHGIHPKSSTLYQNQTAGTPATQTAGGTE